MNSRTQTALRSHKGLCVMCAQSCLTLCDPKDCSPPGFCVYTSGVSMLEWAAISSSKNCPNPGIKPVSPALEGGFFTTEPPGKPFISTTNSSNYDADSFWR